jgi:hypothetical protein
MVLPFQTSMLSSYAVADRCALVSSLATSRDPVLRAPFDPAGIRPLHPRLRNASSTCRDTSIASSLAQRVFDLQGYVHRILAGQRVFDLLQVLLGLTERAVVALVVARTVEISHSTAPPVRSSPRLRQMRRQRADRFREIDHGRSIRINR